MKVFISWSGDRSKLVAESLAWWFPKVIQAVIPWISTEDIDQGASWFGEITNQLSAAQFGVFCLTTENLQAPWLLFEAGAVWKGQSVARPCAYLLGLSPVDVAGPFAQFQLTEANRDDTWKLMLSMNAAMEKGRLGADALKDTFDVWWPKLEERLAPVLAQQTGKRPQRKDREILEEILQVVRGMASRQATRTEPADARAFEELIRGYLAQLLITEIEQFLEQLPEVQRTELRNDVPRVSLDLDQENTDA